MVGGLAGGWKEGREEGREGRSLVEILEKEQGLDQGKERGPRSRDPLILITSFFKCL